MVIRRLMMASILSLAIVDAGRVFAQAAFPAPLPGRAEAPASTAPVPHVEAAASPAFPGAPSGIGTDACMNGFLPLREEAEKRGRLIKAASERKASPDEACKLVGDFGQAEIKIIKYVETNSARCGIPPTIADQLSTAHKKTEAVQQKICAMAQQKRAPSGPVGDFWPASSRKPAGPLGDFWEDVR